MTARTNIDLNVKTKKTSTVRESVEAAEFDIKDSKGRAMGASILRTTETYELMTDAEVKTSYFCSFICVGTWYVANIQTTRDGKCYGASQPNLYFASVEARDEAVHAHLARSMKAAAKKAAK